jgi:hypothetical protein
LDAAEGVAGSADEVALKSAALERSGSRRREGKRKAS